MKTRIFFQPATQIHNAGDQLINLATLNAIRRHGEIVINDLRTPAWFIEGIGSTGDRRFSEFAPTRFYLNLVRLLLKQRFSGERLQNVLLLPPGHVSRKGLRPAWGAFMWFVKLLLLRILGCRVVWAGFSIGPFDRANGWVESFGTRCLSYYGLRDTESLALAKRFHFSGARYFPDLAWSFIPRQRCSPAPTEGPVVVSFRSNAYGVVHSSAYLAPIRDRLCQLLNSASLAGKRVVVAFQVQSDEEASRELCDHLRTQGIQAELSESRLSIDGAASLYAGACCVISNRLHVLLLAAQSGTLPIPLADMKDNVKITSILKDNSLSDITFTLEEDNLSCLDRLNDLIENRNEVLDRFSKASVKNSLLIDAGFRDAIILPHPSVYN